MKKTTGILNGQTAHERDTWLMKGKTVENRATSGDKPTSVDIDNRGQPVDNQETRWDEDGTRGETN